MSPCSSPGWSASFSPPCLDTRALDAWGWRVALLLGAVIVPVGFVLRRTLLETLPAPALRPPEPARAGYVRFLWLGLILLGAATTTNYLLEYMTTYASVTLGMPRVLPSARPRSSA